MRTAILAACLGTCAIIGNSRAWTAETSAPAVLKRIRQELTGGGAFSSEHVTRLNKAWYWLDAHGQDGNWLSLHKWDEDQQEFSTLAAWNSDGKTVMRSRLLNVEENRAYVCADVLVHKHTSRVNCWEILIGVESAGKQGVRRREVVSGNLGDVGAARTDNGIIIVGVFKFGPTSWSGLETPLMLYALDEDMQVAGSSELVSARGDVAVTWLELEAVGDEVLVVWSEDGPRVQDTSPRRICLALVDDQLSEVGRVCTLADGTSVGSCPSLVQGKDGATVVQRYLPEWMEKKWRRVTFDASIPWLGRVVEALPEVAVNCRMELVTSQTGADE